MILVASERQSGPHKIPCQSETHKSTSPGFSWLPPPSLLSPRLRSLPSPCALLLLHGLCYHGLFVMLCLT